MMRPAPDTPAVYLCIKPVDFRKAIQGLSLLVEQGLELNLGFNFEVHNI